MAEKFFITEKCVGCSACASDCPMQAIDSSKIPHEINQRLCIGCGDCFEICPVGAIKFCRDVEVKKFSIERQI